MTHLQGGPLWGPHHGIVTELPWHVHVHVHAPFQQLQPPLAAPEYQASVLGQPWCSQDILKLLKFGMYWLHGVPAHIPVAEVTWPGFWTTTSGYHSTCGEAGHQMPGSGAWN